MRLFLFASIVFFGVNSFAETTPNKNLIKLTVAQSKAYGITTEPLKKTSDVLGARYPAEVVVPNSQLQVISALQGGLVERLLAAEGDAVKKGQSLARIQSPSVLELQRDLLQTLSQLNLAKSSLNRDKQLFAEGIIPKRRYLESLSAWQELVTQKEQQEATLQFSGMSDIAIAKLEKTRKLIRVLTVVAPFDGVLLEQMVISGQKLSATDPLFKIGKLSPLWVEIHVPVSVVNTLKIGDRISVPDFNVDGHVITIGQMVHVADQGTLVRALVKDNIEHLRPGQVVQARFAVNTNSEQRYLVPRKSIARLEGETIIFIKNSQGFEAVYVSIVGSNAGQQIITSITPITSDVVTSGAVTLKAILTGAGGEG